ncbi:MAG TPA: PRC-barrel domain-containing protein [Devosia sp.]|jgi:hypothetical protein|nr:PRC-barrel domain-containing protein [Devosia sp.]
MNHSVPAIAALIAMLVSPTPSPAAEKGGFGPLRPADDMPAEDFLAPAVPPERHLRIIEPELRAGQEVGWPRDFTAGRSEGQVVGEDQSGAGAEDDKFTEWDADPSRYLTRDELGTGLLSIHGEEAIADADDIAAGLVPVGEIMPIQIWIEDRVYETGVSARNIIAGLPVHGLDGVAIGSTEDLLVGADGKVLALVATIGGFWDMGGTEVRVPWYMVEVGTARVTVPFTEVSIAGIKRVQGGSDAWRITSLIGKVVRLQDADIDAPFAYAQDVLVQDGRLAAMAVSITRPDLEMSPPWRE